MVGWVGEVGRGSIMDLILLMVTCLLISFVCSIQSCQHVSVKLFISSAFPNLLTKVLSAIYGF